MYVFSVFLRGNIRCNGEGKLPEGHDGIKVCPQCQGFGIIKKKEMAEEKTIEFRGVRMLLPKWIWKIRIHRQGQKGIDKPDERRY